MKDGSASAWQDLMTVYAISKDRKLGASVLLAPDQTELTIRLQRTGTVQGQVIDAATGQVAGNRVVRYAFSYEYLGSPGTGASVGFGSVNTDAEGRFATTGLVPGMAFRLYMPLDESTEPSEWRREDLLAVVRVKDGETIDLGTVEFRREMEPGELLDVVLTNNQPTDKRLQAMTGEQQPRASSADHVLESDR